MSFQILLDSIIDLSNETITFIMPCILCLLIRSLNSKTLSNVHFSSIVSQLSAIHSHDGDQTLSLIHI